MNNDTIAEVRAWVDSMVIGLGLCPFAERVQKAGAIRYVECDGQNPEDLLLSLSQELKLLAATPRSECETTLLIAPEFFPDFLDFNDFLGIAEQVVEDLEMTGEVQVVGFHPLFQFDGTDRDAPENYTNRSPYPMLHLLREISITEIADNAETLLEIPKRNTALLQKMGREKILERLRKAGGSH